ncbi:MAG TPA: RpiB/LacA/LacB family sugar-phosphate isomerase [Sphaerochaeta sp.]|nr:RpiB/LacA/LacB family sugar-phosphate isomerase [Sphaerochaeta sp.]
MSKKIVVANDHGAVALAQRLIDHLKTRGFTPVHLGVTSEDSVDYPDMAEAAAKEYFGGDYAFGLLLCGTGIGISISANKVDGIRCALPQNRFAAEMARAHNDANFIAFGGRIDYPEDPVSMLDAFIDATFGGERHQRRVDKIMALEH